MKSAPTRLMSTSGVLQSFRDNGSNESIELTSQYARLSGIPHDPAKGAVIARIDSETNLPTSNGYRACDIESSMGQPAGRASPTADELTVVARSWSAPHQNWDPRFATTSTESTSRMEIDGVDGAFPNSSPVSTPIVSEQREMSLHSAPQDSETMASPKLQHAVDSATSGTQVIAASSAGSSRNTTTSGMVFEIDPDDRIGMVEWVDPIEQDIPAATNQNILVSLASKDATDDGVPRLAPPKGLFSDSSEDSDSSDDSDAFSVDDNKAEAAVLADMDTDDNNNAHDLGSGVDWVKILSELPLVESAVHFRTSLVLEPLVYTLSKIGFKPIQYDQYLLHRDATLVVVRLHDVNVAGEAVVKVIAASESEVDDFAQELSDLGFQIDAIFIKGSPTRHWESLYRMLIGW